jgi:hypothetical protein
VRPHQRLAGFGLRLPRHEQWIELSNLMPRLSSLTTPLTNCWRFRQYLSTIYNKRLASDETSFW